MIFENSYHIVGKMVSLLENFQDPEDGVSNVEEKSSNELSIGFFGTWSRIGAVYGLLSIPYRDFVRIMVWPYITTLRLPYRYLKTSCRT